MGFFKEVLGAADPFGIVDKVGGMFGGGEPTTSGFQTLPKEIQDAFKQYAEKTSSLLPTAGSAFTPMGATADEDNAFSAIRGGFAPTQSSIGSDIGMQMNPFNDSVINDINRQAGGEFSVLKGVLDEGGAFGSNREMLGANDIDLSRLNQIGRFKQDQYNSALNNAMTTMPKARAQDAQNLLSIGDRERGLDSAIRQGDINGLLALGKSMSVLPQSGGTIVPEQGMTIQDLASIAGGVGGAMAGFSDRRLKEDVKLIGKENGHNIYEFKYIGKPEVYRGVMAQEVLKIKPEAVIVQDGHLAVYYDQIGVDFRRVA